MKANKTSFLMYHEIYTGRCLCRNDRGYRTYAVDIASFKQQLHYLKDNGFSVHNLGEFLNLQCNHPSVVCTFDDGCETDLMEAAPLLWHFGYRATFFVVAGYVGKSGYLSAVQLRELSRSGFEIGSHSMTHAFLTDLPQEDLAIEVMGSKDKLEQIIGKPVNHLSCPGGRWSRKVASTAASAGYQSVATSRSGANSRSADPYRLNRIPIFSQTKIMEFAKLISGKRLFTRRMRSAILEAAKWSLGNHLYDKMHRALPHRF